jgi:membrane glycosyltransferase
MLHNNKKHRKTNKQTTNKMSTSINNLEIQIIIKIIVIQQIIAIIIIRMIIAILCVRGPGPMLYGVLIIVLISYCHMKTA